MRFLRLVVVLALIAAAAWFVSSRYLTHETPPGQAPLTTLDAASLEGLREDFNRAADQTRWLVLLSPT